MNQWNPPHSNAYPFNSSNQQNQQQQNQQQTTQPQTWMNPSFSRPQQYYHPQYPQQYPQQYPPQYHPQYHPHHQRNPQTNHPMYPNQSSNNTNPIQSSFQNLVNKKKIAAATTFNDAKKGKPKNYFRHMRVSVYIDAEIPDHDSLLEFLKDEDAAHKGHVILKLKSTENYQQALTAYLTITNNVFHGINFQIKEVCKFTKAKNWRDARDYLSKPVERIKHTQNHTHMFTAFLVEGKINNDKNAKSLFGISVQSNAHNNNTQNNYNNNNSQNPPNNNNNIQNPPNNVGHSGQTTPSVPPTHSAPANNNNNTQNPPNNNNNNAYPAPIYSANNNNLNNAPSTTTFYPHCPNPQYQSNNNNSNSTNNSTNNSINAVPPPITSHHPTTNNSAVNNTSSNNNCTSSVGNTPNDIFLRFITDQYCPSSFDVELHPLINFMIEYHQCSKVPLAKSMSEFDLRMNFNDVFISEIVHMKQNDINILLKEYKKDTVSCVLAYVNDAELELDSSLDAKLSNVISLSSNSKPKIYSCQTCGLQNFGSECTRCKILKSRIRIKTKKDKARKKSSDDNPSNQKQRKLGNSHKKQSKSNNKKSNKKSSNKKSSNKKNSDKNNKNEANTNKTNNCETNTNNCETNTNNSNKNKTNINKTQQIKPITYFEQKYAKCEFTAGDTVYIYSKNGTLKGTFWPGRMTSTEEVILFAAKKAENPGASRSRSNITLSICSETHVTVPSTFLFDEQGNHAEGLYWVYFMEQNNLPTISDIDDDLWKAWKAGEQILFKENEENDKKKEAKQERNEREEEAMDDEKKKQEFQAKWGKQGGYDGRQGGKGFTLFAGQSVVVQDRRPGSIVCKDIKYLIVKIVKIPTGWEVEMTDGQCIEISEPLQPFDLNTTIFFDGKPEEIFALRSCLLIPSEVEYKDDVDEALEKSRKEWRKNKTSK